MNIANLMKFRSIWNDFTKRHPKFPLFIEAVSSNGITEGSIIEIAITDKDGRKIDTNLLVKAEDMELLESLKQMM